MKLNIQKWNPWNWFKHEAKEEASNVPVQYQSQGQNGSYPTTLMNDHPIWNIHREIDRMFDGVFSNLGGGRLPRLKEKSSSVDTLDLILKPNVDIKERKKDYKITVEIPGVEKNDLKLELTDGILTITGEKKYEKEEKEEHYHCIERSYGSFRRLISLPEDADTDSIDAKMKDGILTITISRKETAQSERQTRQIEVK